MTDFQRAWESDTVLGPFLRLYDRAYRRLLGLAGPRAVVGPVLRVRVTRHRGRPLRLREGTEIRRGDPVGHFHLNNEGVAALHEGGPRAPFTGLAFRRAVHASLEALARRARTDPAYREVRAFTARTIFHHGTELLGFEVRPLPGLRSRVVAVFERRIMAHFHPLGKRRPGRPRFAEAREIWISRDELCRRYAAERSSPSGTHA